MNQVNKTEAIIVRVSPDLKKSLTKLAQADDRKLSDFIRVQLQKIASPKP